MPALARLRTEFTNYEQETAFATAQSGADPAGYLAWLRELQADVIPVVSEVAAGHPDAAVRQLAVLLEDSWRGYSLTTSSAVHVICRSETAVVWEGHMTLDQLEAEATKQKAAAAQAVTALTEAIHNGIEPSVLADRMTPV